MEKKRKPRQERLLFRVTETGDLRPYDERTRRELRSRRYRVGDVLSASDLKKPRSPEFHRLAHQLGALVAENIDKFTGMDAHAVLKDIQLESGIGCEETMMVLPGLGNVIVKHALSLSYESMDQGQFYKVIRGFCHHISKTYWPSMSPERIERMAGVMVDPA